MNTNTNANTPNEIEYIKTQYIRMGLLNNDGTKIPSKTGFDYNIYPWEKGYIPKCDVCTEMYNKNKTNKSNNTNEALNLCSA
jgi:hypothetical protein